MDDLIERYYESEMRYLREAGKAFAKIHPDRAGMLNMDRIGDRDPYVERLFEGFAFLMGKMRQKIDDDLPELTESLVSLLWPHYLRLIPSLSILQITPDLATLSRKETIAAGFDVMTDPIGMDKTECQYRTTKAMIVQPISLTRARATLLADGRSAICVRIAFGALADFEQMDLSCLRVYLNADAPVASALYYALTQQLSSMFVRFNTDPEQRIPFPGQLIPAGFAEEDRLWLKPDNAFSGYQLLLEYFSFREKFMFLDLKGLDITQFPEDCTYFDVEWVLNESWPAEMPFNEENICLHCVPMINLFSLEADPVRVNQLESEYLLRPLLQQDGHVEIYSVEHVEAMSHSGRYPYTPFTQFKHRGGMLRHDAPERYYHTRVRKGPSGLHDTWLILGGKIWDRSEHLEPETLSLQVTGTNGMLPHKALRNARIHKMRRVRSHVKHVRNLCSPTLPCYPPTEDRFQWRVLSHLAPNYVSLMNKEVLQGTLALYDWTHNEMNRRRLEGIVEVTHRSMTRIEEGAVHRGVGIEVTVNSHQFSGQGDILLFGELLHHFFALYADLNLFTQFSLLILPTGKTVTWPSSKQTYPTT